jgi:hypothetical protein
LRALFGAVPSCFSSSGGQLMSGVYNDKSPPKFKSKAPDLRSKSDQWEIWIWSLAPCLGAAHVSLEAPGVLASVFRTGRIPQGIHSTPCLIEGETETQREKVGHRGPSQKWPSWSAWAPRACRTSLLWCSGVHFYGFPWGHWLSYCHYLGLFPALWHHQQGPHWSWSSNC